MPWLRFTADMDWKPKASVTLAYRTGDVCNVTRGCADAAVKAGKGVLLKRRSKDHSFALGGVVSQATVIGEPELGEAIYSGSWGRALPDVPLRVIPFRDGADD